MTDAISNSIRPEEDPLWTQPRTSVKMARRPSYKATSNSSNNGNSTSEGGCSETLYKYLGYLMMYFSFVPMFIAMFVGNMRIAATLAMGIAVLNNLFAFFMYKMGKTRSWPKPLDVIFFILFLVQTIAVWVKPDSNDFWRFWGGVYFNLLQALLVAIFWYFGNPFTKSYAEDDYGIIGATHPMVMFGIRCSTGAWVTAFFLSGVLCIPSGIYNQLGNVDNAVSAMKLGAIGSTVVIVSALVFSFSCLPWYMNKYEDAIFDRYETEIMEWKDAHPDEELAKLVK